MTAVVTVDDGPAGPTAALFAQENGPDAAALDADGTWMHNVHLFNYPGLGSMDGSVFMGTLRNQVNSFDIDRPQGTEATDVAETDDGPRVETDADPVEGTYLALATGANRDPAEALGCEADGDVVDIGVSIETGVEMGTGVESAYATGASIEE